MGLINENLFENQFSIFWVQIPLNLESLLQRKIHEIVNRNIAKQV